MNLLMLWEPVWQVSSEPTLLKYIGPFDQSLLCLSLEPGQHRLYDEPAQHINNVNYILCVSLEPEHGQCRTFKVENKAI